MKKWYHSKTIIFNGIAGIIAILPEILALLDVKLLTAIGISDPMKYYSIIAFATTALNIYLRAQSPKPSEPIKTIARVKKNRAS